MQLTNQVSTQVIKNSTERVKMETAGEHPIHELASRNLSHKRLSEREAVATESM